MSILQKHIETAKRLASTKPWHYKTLSVLRVIPEDGGITVFDAVGDFEREYFYTWGELEKATPIRSDLGDIVHETLLLQQSVDFMYDSRIKEAEITLNILRDNKIKEYQKIFKKFDIEIAPFYDKIVEIVDKNTNIVINLQNSCIYPSEEGIVVNYAVLGFEMDYVVSWDMLKEIWV